MLATTTTSVPLHSARWDPFTVNEFCAVGSNGTVLFWMLDETGNDGDAALNVHEAQIPAELLQTHHMVRFFALSQSVRFNPSNEKLYESAKPACNFQNLCFTSTKK